MATAKSSNPLHNFAMPRDLRWGNQRHLRCMKLDSAAKIDPLIPSAHRRRDGEVGRDEDRCSELLRRSHDFDGIAAVRESLMLDLQTAADRMKHAIFKDGFGDGEASASGSPPPPISADGEISKPWNLRTRRAACKTPARGSDDVAAAVGKSDSGISAAALRLRSGGGGSAIGEKRERAKFSVMLSKAEIEEDFFGMVGRRPPRRPKKRARTVQKQLNTLFPGLWLTEVRADMYKVCEDAP